jgi:hypothetical protein
LVDQKLAGIGHDGLLVKVSAMRKTIRSDQK